jgi:predicted MFS family arabinose efflux permease
MWATACPYEQRQAAIGSFLTGNVMATLLAGPISGVLGEHLGWRASFVAGGAMAAGVGAVLLWRLRVAGTKRPARGAASAFASYAKLLRAPSGRRLLLLAAADGALLFGGAFPFVASFLIEDFFLIAGEAGLVVAGFGVGAFAYTRMAGWLVRRFGERGLLLWGGGGLAVLLMAHRAGAALGRGAGGAGAVRAGLLHVPWGAAGPRHRGSAGGAGDGGERLCDGAVFGADGGELGVCWGDCKRWVRFHIYTNGVGYASPHLNIFKKHN